MRREYLKRKGIDERSLECLVAGDVIDQRCAMKIYKQRKVFLK